MAEPRRKTLLACAVAAGALVLGACRNPSPPGEDAASRGGPGPTTAGGSASASRLDARPRAWPQEAPPPYACQTHDECEVVVWDGPQPPDPCCDQRVGYLPMSRAHLAFMAEYRKKSCGGVTCPTPPFPGAEPACCAAVGRCVARRCVSACEDPTAHVPRVSVLDPACHAFPKM